MPLLNAIFVCAPLTPPGGEIDMQFSQRIFVSMNILDYGADAKAHPERINAFNVVFTSKEFGTNR